MDSKRTYMYNVVLQENDVCPQGELLNRQRARENEVTQSETRLAEDSKG